MSAPNPPAKILVVDDNPVVRLGITHLLTTAGFEVIEAGTGAECIRLAREASPDLVLLDVMLPDANGVGLCREMKTRPELHSLFVVLLSSTEISSDRQVTGLEAGADGYIARPIENRELLARVRAMLRLQQAEAALRKAHTELQQRMAETVKLQQELQASRDAAEKLLLNVLPAPIAERLKTGQGLIADCFPEATILFADLHDFSRLTASLAAADVVKLLNGIFSRFDALMQKLGLEKIKTIGDAYMVAGGVPVPRADHAEAIAEAALALQQEIVRHEAPNGETFSLRIGINTGPVVAGVIGTTKFSYDLWGETVNTARQMEASGASGCIQINETTYAKLRDKYRFEDRGEFYVKGKGEVKTYFLKGRQIGRT